MLSKPFALNRDFFFVSRFRQAPGFCRLQLIVLDFDVLWSPQCYKDYLLIDQRARYCSKSLQSSTSKHIFVYLTFRQTCIFSVFLPFRNGFASVDFISDAFFSTRGFRAVFRQIPCYSQTRRDENCRNTYLPPKTTENTPRVTDGFERKFKQSDSNLIF